MRTGRLVAVTACALLLAGCSVNARTQLQSQVQKLTADANDRDPAAVVADANALLQAIAEAVRNGDISSAQGQRLTQLATLVRDRAPLLQVTPTPTPTTLPPSPTRTPSRSPTPSPTPSPSPTTASPTPSPTPSRTTPPPTTPAPVVSISPAAATTAVPSAASGSPAA